MKKLLSLSLLLMLSVSAMAQYRMAPEVKLADDEHNTYNNLKRKIAAQVLAHELPAYTTGALKQTYTKEQVDTLGQICMLVQVQMDPQDPFTFMDSMMCDPLDPSAEMFPDNAKLAFHSKSKPRSLQEIKAIEFMYSPVGFMFEDASKEGFTLYFIDTMELEKIIDEEEKKVMEKLLR